MGFKIKKTVNGETVWESIKAKKYTASKTIEYTGTLPITINANGQPLLDYQISGNTEQTGTPTPENPIMPIGCGERTENLWDWQLINITGIGNRYGIIIPSTGTYTIVNGTINAMGIAGVSTTISSKSQTTIALNENDVLYRGSTELTYNGEIMVVPGSTAPTSYIPYGYKLPILSNSTVTNIYLGEVQTTRRIKKLVLTGNESGWGKSQVRTGSFYLYNPEVFTCIPRFGCCNVAQNAQSLSDYNYGKMYAETPDTINLWLFDTNLSTDDFKNYLRQQYAAGTPVTVWYVLAKPETGIVNEPLMKIDDYADTVSMEQAGVSIPTNNGSTAIDYNGTLKPSQMYIKYNSWSGWSDIDDYKMVNGDWTQEMT